MHRFYVPPEQCHGELLTLPEAEAHHAAHVLRVRPGDQVTILNGAGRQFHCRITAVEKRAVTARIVEQTVSPALPFKLTLIQALPKGKIIESIIQKATELGVARIIPLVTERVVTQISEAGADQKAAKWQAVAIEAIKQCGAAWLPKVEPPIGIRELIAQNEQFDLSLVGSLQPGSKHPEEFFDGYLAEHRRLPETICVWVGPEGDFSADEIERVVACGARPITLGPLVLRVETAALYCLSVINYEMRAARQRP